MAMDFNVSAVHGVNAFLWSKLQSDLGWSVSDYQGLIPMTTPQQNQEFNDMGKPYIIYNYRTATVGGVHGYKEDHVVYLINSTDEGDIRKVLNLADYWLGGQDMSAMLIGDYVNTLNPNPYSQFDYKSVMTPTSTGATPATQEGGIKDGTFEFSVRYTSSRVLGFE